MNTITPSSATIRSQASSWTSPLSNAASNGISSVYSFLKDQVIYPLTSLDPERVSLPNKEKIYSFSSSLKRNISNITTKQCVTAVALVTLGTAYYQAPTFENVAGRIFDYMAEHSTHQPASKESSYDLLHVLLGSVVAMQTIAPLMKKNPFSDLNQKIGTLHQGTRTSMINNAQTTIGNIVSALNRQDMLQNKHMALIAQAISNLSTAQQDLLPSFEALKAVVFDTSADHKIQFLQLKKLIDNQPGLLAKLLFGIVPMRADLRMSPITPPAEHAPSAEHTPFSSKT